MAAAELPESPTAEPNPFSFREFVRSKARSGDGAPSVRAEEPFFFSPRPPSPPQAAQLGPLLGSLLLPGPAPPGGAEEDEDEAEWSGSYRPAAAERAHLTAAFCEGGGAPRRRSYEEVSGAPTAPARWVRGRTAPLISNEDWFLFSCS